MVLSEGDFLMRALCLLAGLLVAVSATASYGQGTVFAGIGTSFLDSTRDFGIIVGLRRIF